MSSRTLLVVVLVLAAAVPALAQVAPAEKIVQPPPAAPARATRPADESSQSAGPSSQAASRGKADKADAGDGMNPTQEIAKEAPTGPALVVGRTELRIGGYLGVTGIYRSTDNGGGTGTRFGSIPYDDVVEGQLSEARLSAQASRLSIRVNAAPSPNRSTLAGYFEMDFNGSTSGTVAVTTTSVGFRLRHAFAEGQYHGRYIIAAGQAYTLMTPAKGPLSIWPSDYQVSYAVDMNYVAGLVWGRSPQVRFTYRPSASFNWAVSVENPEQQLGSGIVALPSCCAADLAVQYNTGSDELKVPNFMPDIVSRAAFNAGSRLHVDVGGVLRVFRDTVQPYDERHKHAGGGASVNARVDATRTSRVLGQLAYGPGLGRYIGGLVPDVTVDANGGIHPIRTFSWVAGLEHRLTPSTSVAGYDSGVKTDQNVLLDTDGTYIGFGYPGSPNTNNKAIHEVTAVFAWQPWAFANRGSMQWNTQVSWVKRSAWFAPSSGSASAATAFLFFTQVRYNLP